MTKRHKGHQRPKAPKEPQEADTTIETPNVVWYGRTMFGEGHRAAAGHSAEERIAVMESVFTLAKNDPHSRMARIRRRRSPSLELVAPRPVGLLGPDGKPL